MSKFLIFLIGFYKKHLSKLKGAPSCRFTPTCSSYAIDAIREWGAVRGLVMTAKRIIRCNPICRCGYDPVPKNLRRRARLARKMARNLTIE